ncbi:MAG: transglycosylase SLT domain-containing protein, partial [Bacteroidales bacterium]
MRYRSIFILLLLGALFKSSLYAVNIRQTQDQSVIDSLSRFENPNATDFFFAGKMDSIENLVSDWMYAGRVRYDSACTSRKSYCPSLPDSVYMSRLENIATLIELPYNEVIKKYIEYYTGPRRRMVEKLLGLSQYYFPMIEQTFDAAGIPLELKYLAVVESALNPSALSKQGASGLWQFMLPTGKHYGLEISTLVDERRNPVKSTQAAANYLKSLYGIYKDWTLAIAAYNCGPGNVNKAIQRTGGRKDYWAIYYNLPKGTREYLPLFIALNYIMNYHPEHEICPSVCPIALDMDTLRINKTLHFSQVAKITGISVEELRAFNPQFKRDIIPGSQKPYVLRLPITSMMRFIAFEDSVLNNNIAKERQLRSTVQLGVATVSSSNIHSSATNEAPVKHTIRNGESLGVIAKKYNVRVEDLKRWNNLSDVNIRAGKTLFVHPPANLESQADNKSDSSDGLFKEYKIKSGDSFWIIARNHNTT